MSLSAVTRMKLSRQQRDDVVAEVLAKMDTLGTGRVLMQRACLYYSAFTVLAIANRGARAILQAGSASWRFKAPALDDGVGPTHYSYEFDPTHPLSAARLAQGGFPEMHCWAAVPATGEIIDLTTRHLPALLREALPNQTWSAAIPAPYFWGRARALPEGWRYVADLQAISIAFALLRRGLPQVFDEMKRRRLTPPGS